MSMEASSRPMRILVADDDHFVRSALLDFLDILGHEALPARDGREAIRLFDQHEPSLDLLITDISMPGIDGFGLIRHIRERKHHLPIIVITGYADHVDLEEIAGHGVPVFNKPLSFSELRQHLPCLATDTASRISG